MISSQRTTALKATQENMAILPTCSKHIHNFDSYSVLYHDQSSQLSFASVILLGVIHFFPSMSITSPHQSSPLLGLCGGLAWHPRCAGRGGLHRDFAGWLWSPSSFGGTVRCFFVFFVHTARLYVPMFKSRLAR